MTPELFVLALIVFSAAILVWGFRVLPGESWQMMAAIPVRKNPDGNWSGWNLTWYGFLIASGNILAVLVFLVLNGSVGMRMSTAFVLVAVMLSICLPASRLVARIIERKPNNSSSAGALFVGIVLSPLVLFGCDLLMGAIGAPRIPLLPVFAAQYLAFVIGEGLGRLGCISFGCCYGKPIHRLPPAIRKVLDPFGFVFTGPTKKISYESGLEGIKVVPIQAMTSAFCIVAGSVGVLLFLKGHFLLSLIIPLAGAQTWRIVSEIFRSDYRGQGKVSVYQKLSPLSGLYALTVALLIPSPPGLTPDVSGGIRLLWDPAILLLLQAIWAIMVIYLGKSKVTGATLSFFVHRDRI